VPIILISLNKDINEKLYKLLEGNPISLLVGVIKKQIMDLLEIKSHWENKNNMNQNKMQTTIISKVLINTKIKTTISNIQKIFKNNPKINL
jgi:hypothetical protein